MEGGYRGGTTAGWGGGRVDLGVSLWFKRRMALSPVPGCKRAARNGLRLYSTGGSHFGTSASHCCNSVQVRRTCLWKAVATAPRQVVLRLFSRARRETLGGGRRWDQTFFLPTPPPGGHFYSSENQSVKMFVCLFWRGGPVTKWLYGWDCWTNRRCV